MKYPFLENVPQSREMTTYFLGYDHTLACQEGAFFHTENVTTKYYPILSPRDKRGFVKQYSNVQGVLDKESLYIIDNGVLYKDDEAISGHTFTPGNKSMAKMGAYIMVMPDKVYYNTEDNTFASMEVKNDKTQNVSFTLCGQNGQAIVWHDAAYYQTHAPAEGDYMMSTNNGKTSLKVYSKITGLWASVTTTYMKIESTGIGASLKKGDGLKITLDLNGISWDYAKNIFVNEDGTKRYSNFVTYEVGANYVTVPALLNENKTFNMHITVERPVPDMSFICECNNRLWGCSTDGHEVYCCKLGDMNNWNVFAGISTDSWAAKVGSDGKFTGAFAYLGYPLFFKEDSIVRIAISAVGAHQVKSVEMRGVQTGSEKSLVMVNELLYYKSTDSVCVYDGNIPTTISEKLGMVTYKNAVAGTIDNRYYIAMQDAANKWNVFVYDIAHKLWTREDDLAVKFFCKHSDELYAIDENNACFSLTGKVGTLEKDISWMVETGAIGYAQPDKKQIQRINVRCSLDNLSSIGFYIQYDSQGPWMAVWQLHDKGTKTFTIPMSPHRCDHYRFRLVGRGNAKVYSITKSYTEGSDI